MNIHKLSVSNLPSPIHPVPQCSNVSIRVSEFNSQMSVTETIANSACVESHRSGALSVAIPNSDINPK